MLTLLENIDYRILAIGSAIFAAISNILAKKLLSDIEAKDVLGLNFLLMTGTLAILSPWFFEFNISKQFYNSIPIAVPLVVMTSIIDLFGNYYYFKSFEKCDASSVTPILSISPGFVFILSWLCLNDKVNIIQLTFAVIVIFCIIIMSSNTNTKNRKYDVLPALFASFLFALSAIPSKYLLANDLINPPTLYEIRAGIIGLVSVMYFGSGIEKLNNLHFRKLFIRSLFVIVQWIFLYASLIKGSAGIAITLSSTAPVFVLLFSCLFLKEIVSLKKILCALMVLIMAILINIY